jgi:hypothetical protein
LLSVRRTRKRFWVSGMRVFAWDANPSIDRFAFKQSEARATELVQSGRGYFVTPHDGYTAVQLSPPAEIGLERSAGKTVALPTQILNKVQHPPRLHYSVPAVGDHRKRWLKRFLPGPGDE